MQQLKFLGVPVWMNGQNYYVPSLSTIDFRRFYEVLTMPDNPREDVLASFDKYIPVIGAAIHRNYPEVTEEELGEWLDLHTFRKIIQIITDNAGLEPVSSGE